MAAGQGADYLRGGGEEGGLVEGGKVLIIWEGGVLGGGKNGGENRVPVTGRRGMGTDGVNEGMEGIGDRGGGLGGR